MHDTECMSTFVTRAFFNKNAPDGLRQKQHALPCHCHSSSATRGVQHTAWHRQQWVWQPPVWFAAVSRRAVRRLSRAWRARDLARPSTRDCAAASTDHATDPTLHPLSRKCHATSANLACENTTWMQKRARARRVPERAIMELTTASNELPLVTAPYHHNNNRACGPNAENERSREDDTYMRKCPRK